jgi:hypothetical protein
VLLIRRSSISPPVTPVGTECLEDQKVTCLFGRTMSLMHGISIGSLARSSRPLGQILFSASPRAAGNRTSMTHRERFPTRLLSKFFISPSWRAICDPRQRIIANFPHESPQVHGHDSYRDLINAKPPCLMRMRSRSETVLRDYPSHWRPFQGVRA